MRADDAVRRARRGAPLALFAVLAGCAWLAPKLQTPRLTVIGVQVRSADFWRQRLQVRLRVVNPNGIRLPIEAITYTLRIDGQTFADGRTAEGFTVPAHGSAEFNTEVTANVAGALLAVFAGGHDQPVHYRLRGKVTLAYGLLRSLPFDERGQFVLK